MRQRISEGKRGRLVGGSATAEALASSPSVLHPTQGGTTKGLQQIFTPQVVARFIGAVVGAATWQEFPVLDLTAGNGALLEPYPAYRRYGIEIDQDQEFQANFQGRNYNAIIGDVQHAFPLLRALGCMFPVVVLNPPFSLEWQVAGVGKGSSTLLAMRMARKLLSEDGLGVLICAKARWEREVRPELEKQLVAVVEVEKLFPGVDSPCVVVFWREGEATMPGIAPLRVQLQSYEDFEGQDSRARGTLAEKVHEVHIQRFGSWYSRGSVPSEDQLEAIRDELDMRRKARESADGGLSPYLIFLRRGKMRVRLSPFARLALRDKGGGFEVLKWVDTFDRQPPSYFALQQREWRALLRLAEKCGLEVDPLLIARVHETFQDFKRMATPMYPLPEVQRLGFLDEQDSIRCKKADPVRGFVAGEEYDLFCSTKVLEKTEEREVVNAKTGDPDVQEVLVARKAMEIRIGKHVFEESNEHLSYILSHFETPDPGDLERAEPAQVKFWTRILDGVEQEIRHHKPDFRFKYFQSEDLVRGLVKGCFVLAWEQGLGKAIGQLAYVRALELGGRLPDGCALFPMPQDLARQFAAEAKRFFGREVVMMGALGRYYRNQQPGGFAGAIRRMEAGTWLSDVEVGGEPRAGEVSVFEVNERVKARRRWCRARNAARHRHETFTEPEVPGVWVVTWFEALAVTGRVDEPFPQRLASKELVRVKRATAEEPIQAVLTQEQLLHTPKEHTKQLFTKFSTEEFCPVCRADTDSGWNGRVCHAALTPEPDAHGHEKDTEVLQKRRQRAGWDAREVRVLVPSKVSEGRTSYHQQRVVGRRECGHVDVQLRRKAAYYHLRDTFRVICVDEGTKIKGDDSLTSKAVRALRARFRVVSSGTPQKNFVFDLFWLLYWALGDATSRFPYSYRGGRERFIADFAVTETVLEEPKRKGDPKRKGRVKALPEVSNLLRLWKLLCSSVVRRRMDEVGCVVSEGGEWTCRACMKKNTEQVRLGGAWRKPELLTCAACSKSFDAIVPLTFKVVRVPWGMAQKKFHLAWLDEDNFLKHFKKKHPNSPVWKLGEGMVRRLVPCLGQLAKLDYACTDPCGDPDEDFKTRELSPWTPMRLRMLQDIEKAVRAGGRCLVGSCLVGVGPWVAEHLRERGLRVGHITEDDAEGRVRTLTPQQRARILLDYREGKYDVLCVSVQAVSLGHNLDCTTDVFCDGFPWDFATWDQFLKRARRLSSVRPVTVHAYYPEGSLGHKKWEGIGDKTDASDLVLDGRIAVRTERNVDKVAVLREMQEMGMRFDGTEVPELQVEAAWMRGPQVEIVVPRRRVKMPAELLEPVQQSIIQPRRRVAMVQPQQGFMFPDMAPLFRRFLIDPPWPEYGGGGRGAQNHYQLLQPEQMPRVIRDSGLFRPYPNSHLYCWATNNYLPHALWLIRQLGFEYKTKLTWVKPRAGLGQYFRGEDELLLFAVRGHGMDPSVYNVERKDLGTVIHADFVRGPDGQPIHSAKPPESYQRIEARSHGPGVEFFARRARAGWMAWGNEAPASVEPGEVA